MLEPEELQKPQRVLVACEYSGRVRDAFLAKGLDAISCDLLPTESPGPHFQGDLFEAFHALGPWDLVIAHPPCTAICLSGNRWYSGTPERAAAAAFVGRIWDLPVERLAIENPTGVLNTLLPDLPRPCWIQPWEHGHGETKRTGLWTRGLPQLLPTNVVSGRTPRVHRMSPSADRWKLRSTTYTGIASAMADQWGS